MSLRQSIDICSESYSASGLILSGIACVTLLSRLLLGLDATAAPYAIAGLTTALYIWRAVARVAPHVEAVVRASALVWIFILSAIFFTCSPHRS